MYYRNVTDLGGVLSLAVNLVKCHCGKSELQCLKLNSVCLLFLVGFLNLCIIEIKLKLVDEKDEEIRVVSAYGTASYPTDPEILSWCQLIPQNAQPPPDTPYIHLYEMSGGETVAGVCQQYRLDSNIKMLFIVANKKQQDLDNEYEHLKACSLSFSIIIIPRRFKPAIQDCLSTANTRCFAVISPIYDEGCTGTGTTRHIEFVFYFF